jgi:hypothetical protein
MGGKEMTKRMGADALGQAQAANGGFDRLVDHAGVNRKASILGSPGKRSSRERMR